MLFRSADPRQGASHRPRGQLGAPEQEYWDVDFVDAQNTARFSTYGRGIWDFVLASPEVIFRSGFE